MVCENRRSIGGHSLHLHKYPKTSLERQQQQQQSKMSLQIFIGKLCWLWRHAGGATKALLVVFMTRKTSATPCGCISGTNISGRQQKEQKGRETKDSPIHPHLSTIMYEFLCILTASVPLETHSQKFPYTIDRLSQVLLSIIGRAATKGLQLSFWPIFFFGALAYGFFKAARTGSKILENMEDARPYAAPCFWSREKAAKDNCVRFSKIA